MSQHKTNQTAIAAKNGELPPKKKKMGKRALQRLVFKATEEITGVSKLNRSIDQYF